MVNPINHATDAASVERYRVEPYVVAADVYSQDRHVGRGGWTWYTGSAAWMYRVGIETILGVTLSRGALRIDPCIPSAWKNYDVTYRTNTAEFRIAVENPDGVCRGVRSVEIDGVARADLLVPLANVTGTHTVRVVTRQTAMTAEWRPGLQTRPMRTAVKKGPGSRDPGPTSTDKTNREPANREPAITSL